MSDAGPMPERERRLRVLCLEDEPQDAELSILVLRQAGYVVESELFLERAGFLERATGGDFDLVLADYRLPGWTGLDALRELRARGCDLPVIIVTGTLGDETAVECLKQGASDYVLKQKLMRLPFAVEQTLRTRELQVEQAAAQRERERLLHEMGERVREMTCVSQVMRCLADGRTLGETLQAVVALIPFGWRFPEIAAVRLRFREQSWCSQPFAETEWKIAAPLCVGGSACGELAVFYLEAKPAANEGPFLREERDLLGMLASTISEALERRSSAEALRASERKYRELFELANDAILIFEPQHETILEANASACELYGFLHSQLLGMSLKDLTQDVARGQRQIAELMRAGRWNNFETVHHRRDGASIEILANSKVIEYAGRTAILTVNHDITELKRAQDQLRQAHYELERRVEERTAELAQVNAELRRARDEWQSTFDCMSEAITVQDSSFHILRSNRAFREMFPQAEIPGALCHRLVHGTEMPPEHCPMARSLAQGQSATCEFFEPHLHRWVSARTDLVRDAEGRIERIVHSLSDISERKEMERMKNDFVSCVSHELRTPLSSLRGFAELMLQREYPPEKQRHFLEIIYRESRRLGDLVNDVLDLQRIESGRAVLQFGPVFLPELVKETAELFAAPGERHRIFEEVPPGLPPVLADPEAVRQILRNLVSNALKYSPEGGEVRIGVREQAGQALIWVSDQGMGIPPELLPHVFSKFYRAPDSVARKIGGTGLGLAVVKGLVEAHHGAVWVESTPGKGSTFSFTLPFAHWAQTSAAA